MELGHQDRLVLGAVFVAVLGYVTWVAYQLVVSLL